MDAQVRRQLKISVKPKPKIDLAEHFKCNFMKNK